MADLFGRPAATVEIDTRAFRRGMDEVYADVLKAARDSVVTETRALERRVEAGTRAVTKGNLWRAWKSAVYPKAGLAKAPVGEVFPSSGGPRSQGAIRSLVKGSVIKGGAGQFLAVPINRNNLPFRFARGRRAQTLTPHEFTKRTGLKLRVLPRRGKNSLLVVDRKSTEGQRYTSRARNAAYLEGPREIVPVFVLVPIVIQPRRLNLEEITRGAARDVARRFNTRLRAIAAQTKD
jgi:hypothetical protein